MIWLSKPRSSGREDTYRVRSLRGRRARRARVRIGASEESLTRFSGLAAVTELTDRLGVIDRLDAAVGPIKTRGRGLAAGQTLVGMAAAQLCGEDFLVGLDRHRADIGGQALTPVPGLALTTAAGLARRPQPPADTSPAAPSHASPGSSGDRRRAGR
jgi:hypothetical protein